MNRWMQPMVKQMSLSGGSKITTSVSAFNVVQKYGKTQYAVLLTYECGVCHDIMLSYCLHTVRVSGFPVLIGPYHSITSIIRALHTEQILFLRNDSSLFTVWLFILNLSFLWPRLNTLIVCDCLFFSDIYLPRTKHLRQTEGDIQISTH